jgi:hypothetical protein
MMSVSADHDWKTNLNYQTKKGEQNNEEILTDNHLHGLLHITKSSTK